MESRLKDRGEPRRSKAGSGRKREPRQRPGWAGELLDWGKTLAVAVLIVLVLRYFVFNLSTVKGYSMEPTLYQGEWLFVNKAVYLLGDPQRGDVVVLKDPSMEPGRKEFLVKRVIGVPGDVIEIRAGQLYRNGEHIVEPYTDSDIEGEDYGPVTIQQGTYFVLGDNRHLGASRDSRMFGQPVTKDAIQGRADLVLWPIAKLDTL